MRDSKQIKTESFKNVVFEYYLDLSLPTLPISQLFVETIIDKCVISFI